MTLDLDSPQIRYALLRTALEMFQKTPAELDEAHLQQVQQRVNNEIAIGQRLLQEVGNARVVVPPESVEQAYKLLLERFENPEAFDQTLAYNGLSRESLRQALSYDLSIEAAMEQLLSREAGVSEEEIEHYYRDNAARFELPETRTVSHILITINDQYPENSREQVVQRMDGLRAQCTGDGARLKQLALQHSECPSAMKEGLIGRVKPGQLFAPLDVALFALEEGGVSEVVESEIGLHILYCEAIHQAETLALEQVREKIESVLEQGKRERLLKHWLQQQGLSASHNP